MKFFSGPQDPRRLASSRSHGSPNMLRALYPLTRTQQGIWFEYQMNLDSTRYNLTLECIFETGGRDPGTTIDSILKGRYLPVAAMDVAIPLTGFSYQKSY